MARLGLGRVRGRGRVRVRDRVRARVRVRVRARVRVRVRVGVGVRVQVRARVGADSACCLSCSSFLALKPVAAPPACPCPSFSGSGLAAITCRMRPWKN